MEVQEERNALDEGLGAQDATTSTTLEEDYHMQLLRDRRAMETREELKRIECMEKVRLLSRKIDRRLGRNLFRKIRTGPLDQKRSSTPQTAPVKPHHLRAQSTDAQSDRVTTDSATAPIPEKPRRGSSGSMPQDTSQHQTRSKRRASSEKKQDSSETSDAFSPEPEPLSDSVSPSRRGLKDTFDSARKKFSRRYRPYEPSENAVTSSDSKRNFKDSFESAKKKFSRRYRQEEVCDSLEEPSSPNRNFKETYNASKSKFTHRYKQQEVSEAPEPPPPKGNFKEMYDTAKSKFSHRHRQQEVNEVVEVSSDTKRNFKEVYEAGKQKFTRRHRGEDYEVGHRALPGRQDSSKESVRKELDEIQKMGVVRSSTASSVMLKNHIRSHLSRMSNHRLTIKSGGLDRKKSSVLVTMDDREEQEREMLRRQNKVVMNKFFEVPSRKQRMLERLSSMQAEESMCSDLPENNEKPIRPHGAKLKQKMDAFRKEMELDSPAIPEGESTDGAPYYSDQARPPLASTSAPPSISSPALLLSLSSAAPPSLLSSVSPTSSLMPSSLDTQTSGDIFVPEKQYGTSQRVVADGGSQVKEERPQRAPSSEEGDSFEDEGGMVVEVQGKREVEGEGKGEDEDEGEDDEDEEEGKVGDELVTEIKSTSFVLAESERRKMLAIVDEKWSSSVIPLDQDQEEKEDELITTIDTVTPEAFYSDRILASSSSSYSAPPHTADTTPPSVQSSHGCEQSLGFSSVQSSLKREQSLQSQQSFNQGSPRSQRSLRSEGSQRSLQSQGSGGFPVSQDSIGSEPSPKTKRHRYSTPQLSLSMSAGDFDSFSAHPSSHGFYSSLEIDVNPFTKEFEAGTKHVIDVSPDAAMEESSDSQDGEMFQDCLFPPHAAQKEIPKEAFNDPGFINYIEGLDHKPVVQDYITYKVQVIGDLIEQKYADKLSQAMDQVFYEVVKESLSWGTFKNVSTWLFLQGSKVQDGIMLVPCFARQLIEVVPHMGSMIGQYTEGFLDMHVSENNLLGAGGWNSLMASYGEEPYEDFTSAGLTSRMPRDYYGNSVDLTTPHPTQDQPALRSDWTSSPAFMTPGSATTMPSKKRRERDTPLIPSFEDPGPSNTPQLLPHPPYCLRRSTSVEVLLEETTPSHGATTPMQHHTTPPPPNFSLSKSLSIGSATPTTPLTFFPQFRNLKSAVFADSNMTPSPVTNGDEKVLTVVHEESRLTARRGSASSVVIISHTHTEIETTDGFDVIGRPLGSPEPHPDETESVSSEFEYMRNPYSVRTPASGMSTPRRQGSGKSTPRRRASDVGVVVSPPSQEGSGRGVERRRSSTSAILVPAALFTVHAVAIGFMVAQQL